MADVDMYTDPKVYGIVKTLLLEVFTMGKLIDRTGQRFGKLTVTARQGANTLKKVMWQCVCDCGGKALVTAGSLVTGNTTSCGCALQAAITKHGGYKKSSYNTWRAMMRRCYNVNDKDYRRYGAVGVMVCSSWHEYVQFERDMGEPVGTETLDRVDTYGDYTVDNCRWATPTVQNRNIRVRKASTSGVTGVRLKNNRWYAEITAKGKKYYSRVCSNVDAAIMARKELERLHWGIA